MGRKAIQDLAQLQEAALFAEISRGAGLCVKNAKRISSDSLLLAKEKRTRGEKILRLAAEEEASKVLILLDAIRCPRTKRSHEFGRQLRYFNEHLAKGIYAQYCGLCPASFGEVRRWVDSERKQYRLDGPNGVDWIFYNDILRRREETIYVDYAEEDGQTWWNDPGQLEEIGNPFQISEPPVLKLMNALNDAGCLATPTLTIIARTWQSVSLDDNCSWEVVRDLNLAILDAMRQQGLLKTQSEEIRIIIASNWLFPLYPLDLGKESVKSKELDAVRNLWGPES